MAKYTLELRELFTPIKFNPPLYSRSEIEGWFKDYDIEDYLTAEEIESIETAGIWSKDKLASMIVDHYYMREIGFETPALFKHYAKIEMQEIMEEYLPLIYSNSIKYDVLTNVDFTESFERTVGITGSASSSGTNSNTDSTTQTGSNTTSGTNNSTSSSTGSGLSVQSDTPQGQISKTAILNGAYASSTGANESTNSTTDNTTTSTTGSNSLTESKTGSGTTSNSSQDARDTEEEYTKRITGNNGAIITNQRLIKEYRDNIRAINKEIIKKLNYLFMGLY